MNLFIWYPKCSTCQMALKALESKNILVEKRNIKEENPTYEELKVWVSTYSIPLKKLFNTSGNVYKELHLKDTLESMTDEEKLKLLSTNGMLVKRPILIMPDKMIIGYDRKEYEAL